MITQDNMRIRCPDLVEPPQIALGVLAGKADIEIINKIA